MPKTLKLSDLYVVGREYTIEAPEGSVTVWLQKMSPVDHETALRRANARRANVLSLTRQKERDEKAQQTYDSYLNELYDVAHDRESLIEFLASEQIAKVYSAREAEVASREEWSEDDYIQGLRDSWNDEMHDRFVLDVNDEDAKRVYEELERFQSVVNEEILSERESIKKDLSQLSDEKLTEKGVKRLVEASADMEWLNEFRRCELWKGVRDVKTKKPYFNSREEIDTLSVQVLGELIQAYAQLNVDTLEGKDSGEAQDS